MQGILFWQKENASVKTQLMVNNQGFIIHKLSIKKGENMTMISIKRIILVILKRLLIYLTLDI